jgi:hypothetical protein
MIGDTPSAAPEPARPSVFAAPPRRSGSMLWIVALIAFALGIVAMYYLIPAIDRWRTPAQPAATAVESAAQPAPQQTITTAAPITLDSLAAREAAIDAQLRTIEERMAGVDAASRTAAGYARRAEGLMIAFAARRALERGLQLGYVEGQLRDRFGADQPQAVATVIAAAKNPLTLADLREGLTRIGPTLTSGSPDEGFLESAWREVSNLVILRRDTNPSPRPDDRLARARIVLDGGDVEAALAEVARMPGAAGATSWIDAAKRYIESRRAVNLLELTAIEGRADPVAPRAAPASLVRQQPGT